MAGACRFYVNEGVEVVRLSRLRVFWGPVRRGFGPVRLSTFPVWSLSLGPLLLKWGL